MSLSAIQDNLVKVPLVQQTTTKTEDVARSQELHHIATQREQNRQGDQVVLQTHQTEQEGIRPDEERDREGQKKKKKNGQGGDDDEEQDEKGTRVVRLDDHKDGEDNQPRAKMRRLNVLA